MNSNNSKELKRPFWAQQPFPWRCHDCGKDEVRPARVNYDAEVKYDGRLVAFTVEDLGLPVCGACGAKLFTLEVDDQINAALRSHLHLLSPEEIRAGLSRLGMTQKAVADSLGIAEATLSRWLNEFQLQSRAMDNLMRVFFAFPEVRSALASEKPDPSLGTRDLVGAGSTNLQ